MSDLDQAIREAAIQGRLDGLTLWPLSDGRWQGNFKTGEGWRVHVAEDPAAALLGALRMSAIANDEDVFG